MLPQLAITLTLSSVALAHLAAQPAANHNNLVARQATASESLATTRRSRTSSAAATAAATTRAAAGGTVPSSPLASLSKIGTATTSEATQALPSTYAAGATPPVKGAPVLPSIATLNPADYPELDRIPPLDSDEMKAWIEEADLANAPDIAPTGLNGCSNSTNAQALADAGPDGNCWWTCGGCTRATDISYCPTTNDWGMSFDDGPSPYTPRLLNLLAAQDIKSTFFIVGSRAISRPEMVQTEYMEGHQLSIHTWAHSSLTTLTNEEIVAELGWTRKIIKDITGVTPNTMRPPYGDIDDRVRYISLKLGLRPVIWTTYNGEEFDTNDWKIGGGAVTAPEAYTAFEGIVGNASTMPNGFIVLAHDLYQQSVDLAVDYILPQVINAGRLVLQPIGTCLGEDAAQGYIETSDNKTAVTQTSSTVPGASGTGFIAFAAATGGSSSTSGTTTSGTAQSTSRGTGSSSSNGGSSTAPSGTTGGASSTPTGAANSLMKSGGVVAGLLAVGAAAVVMA